MSIDRADLQAMLLSGMPQLPHARYLLLRFAEPAATRSWVRIMADTVRHAGEPPPLERASVQLAFSYAGLEHLELSWQALKGFSREFREGMAGSERRRRRLGDVGVNAPERWRWGSAGSKVPHAMLLLFAPTAEDLERLTADQRALFDAAGVVCFETLETRALPQQKEHFGFRDGISQPKLVGVSSSTAKHELVAPGEFVLGEPNERGEYTTRPVVDPIEDPDNLLPEVPEDSDARDLGRSGTYLVFRQLSQDVPKFWAWTRQAAGPDAAERIRLASKMVGRWPGGVPFTGTAGDPMAESRDNDFLYHDDDRFGLGCPLGAHIRRTNPRDSLPPKPGTDESLAINRRHRLLRRGRAYGPPLTADLDTAGLLEASADGAERGLHFVCLNADISRQFEFVQHTWAENPNFAGLTGEVDPIIGARIGDVDGFTVPQEPVRDRYYCLPQFVTVRGGAYLFLPGIRALAYIGSEPRALATEYSAPDALPTLLRDTWYGRAGRLLNRGIERAIAVSRRATRLRNAADRVLQEPLTNIVQGLLRWRRRRYRIDADLALAEEREIPGEAEAARRITEHMTAFLFRHYRDRTAERAGNTKTYGLLEAELAVPELPSELCVGLFAVPRNYRAWVRFGGPGPLATPDMRNNGVLSIGVKVTGVTGETLLDDEQGTQDFSAISAPTFTTPDVVENLKLQQNIGAGTPVWYFLNPFDSHYLDALMQGLYAKAHGSPFETSYWSCVPYLFGEGRACKYRFAPKSEQRTRVPLPAPDDYLRQAMVANLERFGAIEFDLKVQFQECPMLMPLEDASVIWRSPEFTVATLRIPAQTFATPERDRMARELTINPWHALPAHRPLGSQNRARRTIYYETSRVRQRINGEVHDVPGDAASP